MRLVALRLVVIELEIQSGIVSPNQQLSYAAYPHLRNYFGSELGIEILENFA